MKVVITGHFSEQTRQRILRVFPREWDIAIVSHDKSKEALERAVAIIPEHMLIDEPVLDRAKHLKLVQTGAGYDNVDVDACTRRGVWVANAAGVNAQAVAEHMFALALCWYKNLIDLHAAVKQGGFGADYTGAELSEKTIGIIGLGKIGRTVARLAAAFGMRILAYHYRPVETAAPIEVTDLETLLEQSDIVSLHAALNQNTRHLIGQRELSRMKKDALLVNTARGSMVDEHALIEALRAKNIGAAALDVFEAEPLPADSPLRGLNNVILTPHTAGAPDGFKFHRKRFEFFKQNIIRVSEGNPPINALNYVHTHPTQPE